MQDSSDFKISYLLAAIAVLNVCKDLPHAVIRHHLEDAELCLLFCVQ